MKTLRKSKEKNTTKVFSILKVKELLQIRGGGEPIEKDKEID